MPATLLLDTVDGTEFVIDVARPQKVRGGLVTGIEGDPATCYDQLIAAAVAKGFHLGDEDTAGGKKVWFRTIRGKPNATDTVPVQLVWDTDFGASPNAYVISYSGYEQAYQTNRIPGTREPLLIPDGSVTTGSGTNTATYNIKGDLALVTAFFPMRRIQVSGIKQGAMPPPGTYDGQIGYANGSDFVGLAKGFWKTVDGGHDFYKLQGWYQYRVAAVTKQLEDWSQIETLYSSKFHVYVTIDDADELTLRNADYDYGIIESVPGGLRWGPYPLTDFGTLFGFSS